MKIIEHRRHSMRTFPGGVHLTQSGVDLARKVGNTMDHFDYVITSPKERAFETAIAMGFAVNETHEALANYGDHMPIEVRDEERLNRNEIKTLLEQEDSFLLQFAQKQVKLLYELSEKIQEGEKLLLISHGGMIDIPLTYLFILEDQSKWRNLISFCEGYRIILDQGKISKYQILRVKQKH